MNVRNFGKRSAGLILALLALTFTQRAEAATYHVATNGDDNRSAALAQSSSTPWRTIQKAVNSMVAGDTTLVFPGTYYENVSFNNKAGTSGGWIRLKNYNSQKPRIQGSANWEGYGSSVSIVNGSRYIEVSGFELTTPGKNTIGISTDTRSHHIRIADCIAHDNGQSGISTRWSDYIFVENNIVYNNSFTGIWHGSGISLYQHQKTDDAPGFHSVVRGNIVYNNIETTAITSEHTDGNGIIIDDFRNTQSGGNGVNYAYQTLVENNLCYGNGAKGIQVYLSDNVTVRNNTCYWNNKDTSQYSGGTWRGELNNSEARNSVWVNNIAVANPAYNNHNTAILIGGSSSTNLTFKNNLTFNGTVGQRSVKIDVVAWPNPQPDLVKASDGNRLGVNPLFVNPGVTNSPDFRIQLNSPAINAGTSAYSLHSTDIGGNPRVVGGTVDNGAYEYSNLLSNPGFEAEQYATQTPSGWSEWSSLGGISRGYSEYGGAKSGNYHATHHGNAGYNMYTYQTRTGLVNGLYTARAWVKSNGGFTACYLEAKDFGGSARTANIAGNWNWNQVVIKDINVTNGQCTVGIWSNSTNGGTMYFDDVEFFRQ